MVRFDHGQSLVVTKAPLRVSFAGGGTDIEYYYKKYEGAFISSTINKYVYVTVKKHEDIFNEQYRLNYAESEICNSISSIRNEIVKECIKLIKLPYPLYISTISDVPSSSGLGSSSSFTVALLLALHTLRGDKVNAAQIVEEAVYIEVNKLRKPIGKQDQLAAAYGGLNFYQISKNGEVNIKPLAASKSNIVKIFDNSFLLWTGISRHSENILSDQKLNRLKNIENLNFLKRQALDLYDLFRSNLEINKLASFLNEGWTKKKKLTTKMTSKKIDLLYESLIKEGGKGGKVCGAGGGGFILMLTDKKKKKLIKNKFKSFKFLDIQYEPSGAEIILNAK